MGYSIAVPDHRTYIYGVLYTIYSLRARLGLYVKSSTLSPPLLADFSRAKAKAGWPETLALIVKYFFKHLEI